MKPKVAAAATEGGVKEVKDRKKAAVKGIAQKVVIPKNQAPVVNLRGGVKR